MKIVRLPLMVPQRRRFEDVRDYKMRQRYSASRYSVH
jgi:hypothetical protein